LTGKLEQSATPAEFTATLPTLSARQDFSHYRWSNVDNRIYADIGSGSVAVINPETLQMEGELKWPSHLWELQPNGRLRVDYSWEENKGGLVATDFLTGKTIWARPLETVPQAIAFSSDGSRLVVIYHPRLREKTCAVEVLSPETGEPIARGTMKEFGNYLAGEEIALLDDRRVLFATGPDGFPVVLDVESGEAHAENLPKESSDGYASSDGRYLAYIDEDGWGHGFALRVWDLQAPDGPRVVLSRERDDDGCGIEGVDFSRDGRFVAVNTGMAVEIYELPMATLRMTAKPGGGALFSPDKRKVAIIRGPQMQIVDMPEEGSTEPVELPAEEAIGELRGFDIDSAGRWIVANSASHLCVWKVGTPFPVRTIANPFKNTFDRPSLDPSGRYFIAGDAMQVWSWPTADKGDANKIFGWDRGPMRPFSATFMADGKELGVMRFGSAWVIDLEETDPPATGADLRIRTLALQSRTSDCDLGNSAFAEDGSRFAFADRLQALHQVKLYALKPERLLRETRIPAAPAAYSRDVKFSAQPDGNDEICVVNLETGKTAALLPWWVESKRHGLGDFRRMAFSESGEQLAVGFSDEDKPCFGVAVFDLRSGKLDQVIWTQRGTVTGIEFCRNDSRIAVLNHDRSIQIFERKSDAGL